MGEPFSAIADRIARYATKLGYNIESISDSRLSDSYYLELSFRKMRLERTASFPCLFCLKVRISDHELPEVYEGRHGWNDFEVGEWQGRNYQNENDWLDCIEWLAEEIGTPLPKRAQKLLRRRDRRRKIASAGQLYGVS